MVRHTSLAAIAAFLVVACGSTGVSLDAGGADATADVTTAAPDASADVGMGNSAQDWCSPGWVNPAGCPATRVSGACANPGLRCVYSASSSVIEVATCDPSWSEWGVVAHWCQVTCPSVPVVGTDQPITCEGPELPCEDDAHLTDYERATLAVDDAAAAGSCLDSEFSLSILLSDGCAIAFVPELQTGSRVADCLSKILAHRRIACARSLRCLTIGRSTIVTP